MLVAICSPSFARAGKAKVASVRHFGVVVGESDGREGAGGENRDPDKAVAQIGPEQSGNDDRDHNQQSAHGGRAGFFLVRFRPFFANVLSDLEFAQAVDDQRAHDQRGKQSGKTGERGAKRQIAKNSKGRKIMLQLHKQQPVEQSASDPAA